MTPKRACSRCHEPTASRLLTSLKDSDHIEHPFLGKGIYSNGTRWPGAHNSNSFDGSHLCARGEILSRNTNVPIPLFKKKSLCKFRRYSASRSCASIHVLRKTSWSMGICGYGVWRNVQTMCILLARNPCPIMFIFVITESGHLVLTSPTLSVALSRGLLWACNRLLVWSYVPCFV